MGSAGCVELSRVFGENCLLENYAVISKKDTFLQEIGICLFEISLMTI
jgi:hypothetical protein